MMPTGEASPKEAPALSLASAQLLAAKKWCAGAAGIAGWRIGFARLLRKSAVRRYVVGYRTLVRVKPELWVERVLGNGSSWGHAFAEAAAELEARG